jgi:hypothetical protein
LSDAWNLVKPALEAHGPNGVAAVLRGTPGPARLGLWNEVLQSAGGEEWSGKSLDHRLELAKLAMADALELEAATRPNDAELADKLLDQANIWSFNLAADLAECWPGDEEPRHDRHREAGLAAALDCLQWRRQLRKGPFPFALAWWARGIHELALGRHAEAERSFSEAAACGRRLAQEQGRSVEVDGHSVYMHLLNAGYAGIARAAGGDSEGRAMLERCLEAFTEQATLHADEAEDAAFGVDQLRHTARRFLPEDAA